MKEVKRKRRVGTKLKLQVPVELIQRIQSLLPLKEAARTCILSKSWLHAWSTIPTLRFHPSDKYHGRRQQARYIKLIRHTLRSLLEKGKLALPEGSRTIKVKNLRHLRKLKIHSKDPNDMLEIHDVPSLRLLSHDSSLAFAWVQRKPLLLNADILGVKELSLAGVIMDDALSDIIKSKFPFLESLAIDILDCRLEILDITCDSLKRLNLEAPEDEIMDVRVNAPNLLFFQLHGLGDAYFIISSCCS